MPSLISEEVEVRFEERPGPPSSFVWRGAEYRIVEVLQEHTVLDRQAAWWKRRHRTHYTIRTESGGSRDETMYTATPTSTNPKTRSSVTIQGPLPGAFASAWDESPRII